MQSKVDSSFLIIMWRRKVDLLTFTYFQSLLNVLLRYSNISKYNNINFQITGITLTFTMSKLKLKYV